MIHQPAETNQTMFDLIKHALWNTGPVTVDRSVFEEMKQHAISALPAGVLSTLSMPADVRAAWQMEIYQQISHYLTVIYITSMIFAIHYYQLYVFEVINYASCFLGKDKIILTDCDQYRNVYVLKPFRFYIRLCQHQRK